MMKNELQSAKQNAVETILLGNQVFFILIKSFEGLLADFRSKCLVQRLVLDELLMRLRGNAMKDLQQLILRWEVLQQVEVSECNQSQLHVELQCSLCLLVGCIRPEDFEGRLQFVKDD